MRTQTLVGHGPRRIGLKNLLNFKRFLNFIQTFGKKSGTSFISMYVKILFRSA